MSATLQRPAKQPLSLRVRADHLEQINKLAAEYGISRTEYVVRACTGRLDGIGMEQRLAELEQRIERLEASQYD